MATALTDAVRELELRSCAEVVVEIRSRSGSYEHADARFASIVAFLALIVLLFSPWTFGPGWVAFDVAVIWLVGLFASRKSDAIRRIVTTRKERDAQAHLVAGATFHERGIANTRAESGILVFLTILERRLEILADRGVLQAVPTLEWNRIVADAQSREATPELVVETVRKLTPLLERHLPCGTGDVDELGNAPRFVSE